MLNNFEKFSFPSIEKDGQKTMRQTDKKKKDKKRQEKTKRKREKRKKRNNKIGHSSRSSSIHRSKTTEEVSGNV